MIMAPRSAASPGRASSNVTGVAREVAGGDVQRRHPETLHERAGAALPVARRHSDPAVEARAERTERLEADLEAGLGHARTTRERTLGALEAQVDEVAVRRHAEGLGERAGQKAPR